MKPILWTDTETTGLSADKHGIIEIGILIDVDGEIVEQIRSTMKPTGRVVDKRALECNGFTREQISGFYPWEEVYPTMVTELSLISMKLKMTDSFILAGQNVAFDNRFMISWEKQCASIVGSEWSDLVNQDKNSFIDTQKIFKYLQGQGVVPASESSKLGNICKYFGVSLENAHTAMGDIEATREVYYKMLEVKK